MRWQNQALCPDPWTSWVNRGTVKQLKALFGPRAAVLLDHVELSDEGQDFSLIGVGGVPATRITPTGDEKTFGAAARLTFGERKAIWTRWIALYRELMLSRGEYLNLYDLVYDVPETHVIRKGDTLYYAFYPGEPDGIVADNRDLYSCRRDSKHFRGRLELRGLDPGKSYRIYDYENEIELGVVTGGAPYLGAEIEHHLLLEVSPVG
jgi:alpha-galactosidase